MEDIGQDEQWRGWRENELAPEQPERITGCGGHGTERVAATLAA